MSGTEADKRLCEKDHTFWQGKRVLVIQQNATFSSNDPAHPIARLHALGAQVTVVARPNASTLESLQTHESIDEVLIFEHTGIVPTILRCRSIRKYDVALLLLPNEAFEKYLPHIAFFIFIRAREKMVLLAQGGVYSFARFLLACLRRTWPYMSITAGLPLAALRTRLHRKTRLDPLKVRKILLVRLDHIGDVIMSTPLIDMLHQQFPNAEIDLLLGPWVTGLFEHDPRIQNVSCFAAPWHDRTALPKIPAISLQEIRLLFKKLRARKYDIALDSRGNFLDSWIAYKSGARVVAGTVGFFYNMAVISNAPFLTRQAPYGDTFHYAGKQHRALAQILSDSLVPYAPTAIFVPRSALANIEPLLPPTRAGVILLSLHVSCGDESRQWPTERFVRVIQRLFEQHGNTLWVFLVGSEKEANAAVEVVLQKSGMAHIINTAGKLSLLETAALLSQMTLHVGNDSGPMHMADAVNTPVVAVFIRMLAQVHAPIRPHHEIVTTLDDTAPVTTIDEERVYQAVCRVINACLAKKEEA